MISLVLPLYCNLLLLHFTSSTERAARVDRHLASRRARRRRLLVDLQESCGHHSAAQTTSQSHQTVAVQTPHQYADSVHYLRRSLPVVVHQSTQVDTLCYGKQGCCCTRREHLELGNLILGKFCFGRKIFGILRGNLSFGWIFLSFSVTNF